MLHDACPTTSSLHRLFSSNNIDGGLCLVSDASQVRCCFDAVNSSEAVAQGLGSLQCRVWGAAAVEEWPLNVLGLSILCSLFLLVEGYTFCALGFAAALAFVCDGCDDVLESIVASTPSAGDVMSSITPFTCVELKDNPTILTCLIESGFYRGPVLKTRPSFAKV